VGQDEALHRTVGGCVPPRAATARARDKTTYPAIAGVGVAVALSDEFAKLYPPETFPRVGVILCGGNLDLAKAAKGFLSHD
jgi:hypothetical protein